MRILLAALMVLAAPAQAHKLKVFATAEGAFIIGSAYFAGGGKAMGAEGSLIAADGTTEARFVTAEDGSFRLQARPDAGHVLVVDAGDGHVARFEMRAEGRIPAPVSATAPSPGMDELELAVARQIRPLREQLDAYEERVRLHDLMGGIGTIFGLFGVYAWAASRRRRS